MSLGKFLADFMEAARIVPHVAIPGPQLRYAVTAVQIVGSKRAYRLDPLTLTLFHKTGTALEVIQSITAGQLLGLPLTVALSLVDASDDPKGWERWPIGERAQSATLRGFLDRAYVASQIPEAFGPKFGP